MQSEQTHRTNFESEPGYPAEPHFNDSRTLRSARPVVPLVDLPMKAGKRWRLAGALGTAILLGAATALMIAYFQRRSLERIAANQVQTAVAQSAATPAEPEISAEESDASENEPTTVENSPDKGQAVVVAKRPTKELTRIELGGSESKVHDVPDVADSPSVTVTEESQNHTDEWLSDRWEERRLRRIARRERRSQYRDEGRGLFRIREIFEGTDRP